MADEVIEKSVGVPRLVSQSFPYETWDVAGRTLTVDMGTCLHASLINAAKSNKNVEVLVSLRFPPRMRTMADTVSGPDPYYRK